MRKLLFPVVMAVCGALLFTACTNDDETGVAGDDLLREYTANFERMFGPVNPAQNFNTQRTVTIDASMANAQGSYTLRVYDGEPGMKGTSLLGKFENLSAGSTSTMKVGASKCIEDLYFVADDGTTRSLTTSPISDAGHVTARFDATTGTNRQIASTDKPNSVTIAFEDLGSTDDFDFNDAVIRVDYVTGTGEADVTLMAVGASFSLKLYYAASGNDLTPLFEGRELHDVMGHLYKLINTNWTNPLGNGPEGVDNVKFVTTKIRVPQDFYIGEDGAPFVLEVNGTKGEVRIASFSQYGEAPQVLVLGKFYNNHRTYHYRWPKERHNILDAHPTIAYWMNEPTDVSWLANVNTVKAYDGYDPTEYDVNSSLSAPAGLEAVDLGLPSGTKWANMNIGATAPEDCGAYFAWGETESKEVFTNYNYKFNTSSSYYNFTYIGEDIAGTEYDAATANWGQEWTIPTYIQVDEFIENTTKTFVIENGMPGLLFTGPNGNSIFLPAVGERNTNIQSYGTAGYYWASTRYKSRSYGNNNGYYYADYFYLYLYQGVGSAGCYGNTGRHQGKAIRPVQSSN
ncbi:MAG: LruC domain-containing protein [Bacteroidaceae bacterium]|nr:LruC domain-containing protein [Bacteroidaceae bacterium]